MVLYIFMSIVGSPYTNVTTIAMFIAAVFSALSGVYGPSLLSNIAAFLKGVDAVDNSDGGTGVNGITKAATGALAIEESELWAELIVQDLEGAMMLKL